MSSKSLVTLFLFVLSAMEFPFKVNGAWQCSTCPVSYKTVGCYKDNGHRPLPTEILNEKDKSSKNYDGKKIDWHNWDSYMAGFACRCAAKAKERGWSVFGLQFYGECWSGPDAKSYKAVGESDDCIGVGYRACQPFDRHCVGKEFTNMVYKIVPECDLKFEQLGCYDDPQTTPRPLPDYLLTDHDSSHRVSSGRSIDWRSWDAYMPELACRCAKVAKAKGFDTFGLQHYGECWSGAKAFETYNKAGPSSKCVDRCFKPCKKSNQFCAGQETANYVYKLTAAESVRPTEYVPDRRNHILRPDKSHYNSDEEMSDLIRAILEDVKN